MKKNAIKIIAFLVAVVLTFAGMEYVLSFKYLDSTFKADSFYKQEENTVDVLVLGSSHAYQGLNTAVFWQEYGIAAFNFCGAAQPIWNTYYYLEEALKTQTPKVIIFDTYYLHMSEDFSEASFAIKNTYGLKWSETKIEAIKASFDTQEDDKQYLFEILQYHSRYSDLNKTDFFTYQGNKDMYENHKGFYCYFNSSAVTERDLSNVVYLNYMTEKSQFYYRKIFELAKEKNIPIIAVAIPFNAEPYHQAYFNEAKIIAEEYNAPFYNFNTDYKAQLGIDYSTDFADNQHLNYLGNTKLTRFFGELLTNEYNVPDRRGDATYSSWEADAQVFYKQLENHNVTKITSLTDYAEIFKNERYKIVVTSSLYDFDSIPDAARVSMMYFFKRLEVPKSEYSKGGMWIFENGEKTYYNDCSGSNFSKAVSLGRYDGIAVKPVEHTMDETQTLSVNSIFANKKDVTVSDYGLNIYVYDNFTQTKVDLVGLNYSNNQLVR